MSLLICFYCSLVQLFHTVRFADAFYRAPPRSLSLNPAHSRSLVPELVLKCSIWCPTSRLIRNLDKVRLILLFCLLTLPTESSDDQGYRKWGHCLLPLPTESSYDQGYTKWWHCLLTLPTESSDDQGYTNWWHCLLILSTESSDDHGDRKWWHFIKVPQKMNRFLRHHRNIHK